MEKTYPVNDEAVENKYVRFVTGRNRNRVAKICGFHLGPGKVIDVVIFLDGYNCWNHVHSHVKQGDRVEIVQEPITLPIVAGVISA